LSELQISELRKAFAICDQDGNGVIDATELRTVLRAFLDEDPTEEEFQQVQFIVCESRTLSVLLVILCFEYLML
jgi:Ca2+-binding EF-hand superfamily protein